MSVPALGQRHRVRPVVPKAPPGATAARGRRPPEGDAEDDQAAERNLRAEAEALRPMLLHAATLLARKEALEVEAALKRNGPNRAALNQWARGFYPKLVEKVVEAVEPAGLAIDAIAARHPAVRLRPADLAAVARAWAVGDVTVARPGEAERAEALADAVDRLAPSARIGVFPPGTCELELAGPGPTWGAARLSIGGTGYERKVILKPVEARLLRVRVEGSAADAATPELWGAGPGPDLPVRARLRPDGGLRTPCAGGAIRARGRDLPRRRRRPRRVRP